MPLSNENLTRHGFRIRRNGPRSANSRVVGLSDPEHGADHTAYGSIIRESLEPGDRTFYEGPSLERAVEVYHLEGVEPLASWDNSAAHTVDILMSNRLIRLEQMYRDATKFWSLRNIADRILSAARGRETRETRLGNAFITLRRAHDVVLEQRDRSLVEHAVVSADEAAGTTYMIAGEGHWSRRVRQAIEHAGVTLEVIEPAEALPNADEGSRQLDARFAGLDRAEFKDDHLADVRQWSAERRAALVLAGHALVTASQIAGPENALPLTEALLYNQTYN